MKKTGRIFQCSTLLCAAWLYAGAAQAQAPQLTITAANQKADVYKTGSAGFNTLVVDIVYQGNTGAAVHECALKTEPNVYREDFAQYNVEPAAGEWRPCNQIASSFGTSITNQTGRVTLNGIHVAHGMNFVYYRTRTNAGGANGVWSWIKAGWFVDAQADLPVPQHGLMNGEVIARVGPNDKCDSLIIPIFMETDGAELSYRLGHAGAGIALNIPPPANSPWRNGFRHDLELPVSLNAGVTQELSLWTSRDRFEFHNAPPAPWTVRCPALDWELKIVSPVHGGRLLPTNLEIKGTAKPGSSIRFSLGSGFSPCGTADSAGNWSCTAPAWVAGSWTLSVIADSGAESRWAEAEFEIIGLSVRVDEPAEGATYAASFNKVTGQASEYVEDVRVELCQGNRCAVRGCDLEINGAFTCNLGNLDTGALQPYKVTVWGVGPDDQKSERVVVNFAVDGELPDVTVAHSASGWRLTFTSKPGSTFWCSDSGDDATFVACTSPYTQTNWQQGPNTLYVYAIDMLEQKGAIQTYTWRIISPPPGTLEVTSPTENGRYPGSFDEVTGAVGEDITEVMVELCDGQDCEDVTCVVDNTTFTFTCNLGNLDDGTRKRFEINVKGYDVGGTELTSETVKFRVDGLKPVVTITQSPTGRVLTFESTKRDSTFWCSDGVALAEQCDSPYSDPTWVRGEEYTLYVYAKDRWGQEGPVESYTWPVGGRPLKTIAVDSPAAGGIYAASFNQAMGEVAEDIVSVKLCLDGDCSKVCTVDAATFTFTCNLGNLDNGASNEHTLVATGYDADDNPTNPVTVNFTVDGERPVVTVAHSASGWRLTFTSKQGSTFWCSDSGDDGTFDECTSPSPHTQANWRKGPNILYVYAEDALGQEGAILPYTWTIISPPLGTLVVTSPTENGRYPGSFDEVTGEVGEDITEVKVKLCDSQGCEDVTCVVDDTDFTFTCDLVDLDDGTRRRFEMTVTGYDVDGAEVTSETVNFRVDGLKPEVTITHSPTGRVLTFTSSKPTGATFWCSESEDEATFVACPSPYSDPNWEMDEEYTLYVYAKDRWGQEGPVEPHTWTVTTPRPGTIKVTSPAEGRTYPASFNQATGRVAEEIVEVALCLDGDCTVDCTVDTTAFTFTCNLGNLDDGELNQHTLVATGYDADNNPTDPVTVNFTIDGLRPVVTISPFLPAGRVLSFSSSKPNSTFACSNDDVTFVPCTSPYTQAGWQKGPNTLYVYAKDVWGQQGETVKYTWTILSLPAGTLEVTSPTANGLYPADFAEVKGDIAEDIATVKLKLCWEGASGQECEDDEVECVINRTTFTFTCDLGDLDQEALVNYGITVTGYNANSARLVSKTVNFRVDGLKPEVVNITESPTGRELTFTSSKPNSTFECSDDDDAFAACPSPYSNAAWERGENTIYVRAKDSWGQTGPSREHTWEITTLRPGTITVDSPEEGGIYPASFNQATGEVAEDIVEVELCLDGDCTVVCTVDTTAFTFACDLDLDDEELNQHTLVATGYDAANTATDPVTVNFTIDGELPKVTVTRSAFGRLLIFTSSKPNSTFECSDDNLTFVECFSPHASDTWSVGQNTLYVRAEDALGQKGPTLKYEWLLERLLWGTIAITSPQKDKTYPASFRWVDGELAADIVRVNLCLDGDCSKVCEVDAATLTFMCDLGNLDNGALNQHTIVARGYDADNIPTAAERVNFTVDGVRPMVSVTHSSDGKWLTLTSSKPDSTFWCSADNVFFVACFSPYSRADWVEGENNTLYVYAKDALDQKGEVLTYTWHIPRTGTINITIESGSNCSAAGGAPLAMLALAFWALARRRRQA